MTQSRWITALSIALFVSLALNVFVAGWAVGHGFGPRGGPGEAGLRVGIERVLRALPADDRRIVRDLFEERRPLIRQQFEALREARKKVGDVLRVEPFNQAAFDRAYAEMRQRSVGVQDAIHAVIAAAVPKLSPAGRLELAEGRWQHPGGD